MKVNFGLNDNDKKVLLKQLESSEQYQKIQNKMRAAVLLCAQELMNETQESAFDQYKFSTDDEKEKMALALCYSFIKSRNLKITTSIFEDRVSKDIILDGEEMANKIASKAQDRGDLLSTIVGYTTD